MPSKQNESTATSFRNPFDDYNANVLTPDLIIRYWYTPFNMGALKDFTETKFFTENMPIILQGFRGSGKTTILKYFSFPVQCERALQNHQSVLEQIASDSGVGFYLRCDDSFLDMFKTVFVASVEDAWLKCFNHYLELFFVQNIINLIEKLEEESSINAEDLITKIDFINIGLDETILSLNDLKSCIQSEMRYINTFKNNALFTGEPFKPKHFLDFYQVSGKLIEVIQQHSSKLKNINFLLLIDEFENLPIELQQMFNNLVKFCKPGMSLRIGRRSENENIVTTKTVNSTEYLREGNDYQLIVLDSLTQDVQEWKDYLSGVAKKRLESFDGMDISSDISAILGSAENLDTECCKIAKSKIHLDYILQGNDTLAGDLELRNKIIAIISYSENPIAESLCALWVARNKEKMDFIEAANYASDAMHAYINKTEHPGKEKFQSDYNNKYRYALTIVICTAYRKEKLYYSFNTLCHLSEGNTRTFINLCKAIISDAIFYEKKHFISTGKVSEKSQSRAIHAYALSEFNSVCSIIQNGKSVRNLILQIGNVLSEYHKDRKVRYPETTQFSYASESLESDNKDVMDVAESWALIKRGKELHRLSASIKEEGYLYTINRIFTPLFNLSYRIRGGVNIFFTSEDIAVMINGEPISKLNKTKKTVQKTNSTSIQMSIWGDL